METLKANQQEVIEEALKREMKGGGLSLPVGFGKTRTSICLGLKHDKGPILVVVSLTILTSWLDEIPKAFGKDFPFEVMHKKQLKDKYGLWTPKPETLVVLTTPEVLTAAYKEYNLDTIFLHYLQPVAFGPVILEYNTPQSSMLTHHVGPGYLYSIKWGCLLIDEIQSCNNILRDKCRAIACIAAEYRWGLSGTMFDEPKMERFLGYYTMLHLDGPRTIPAMKEYMGKVFKGFRQYLVERKTNEEFIKPEYIEEIVTHDLDSTELKLFEASREVLKSLNDIVKAKKKEGDTNGVRTFNAYILSLITYIRQFLISPIIPISGIYCDVADFSERSELSTILADSFRSLKLDSWLDDESNIISSRFRTILARVENHKNDHILIFSCFRSTTTLMKHLLDERGYNTYTITSNMSSIKRRDVIQNFQTSEKGILLLPYSIGAEGLNLQRANVVMLMDLWWNSAKIQQAIGRSFRPGQLAQRIFVYIFISNTGMENELIRKNDLKNEIIRELQTGTTKIKMPRLTVKQIINIISSSKNGDYLLDIRSR
jgi:SNF2 family DNA or RNA helicase